MAVMSQEIGTALVTFATVPRHQKVVPTCIKIYNPDIAPRIITGVDVFTTDAAVVASTGSADAAASVEKQMLQVSVGTALTADIPENELEDCQFIGIAKFQCDAVTSVSPTVSMFYHLV